MRLAAQRQVQVSKSGRCAPGASMHACGSVEQHPYETAAKMPPKVCNYRQAEFEQKIRQHMPADFLH